MTLPSQPKDPSYYNTYRQGIDILYDRELWDQAKLVIDATKTTLLASINQFTQLVESIFVYVFLFWIILKVANPIHIALFFYTYIHMYIYNF